MKALLLLALGALVSCRRYADFDLPPPGPSPAYELNWRAEAQPSIPRAGALDVLNPSVVTWQGRFLNLYSRFDGQRWDTVAAFSSDGHHWEPPTLVLSPALPWEGNYIAANGALIEHGGELLYLYQAGPKGRNVLGLARSRDGRQWRKEPSPVLTAGPRMSWDELSLGDPYLWKAGGYLYVCYLGEDRARRQRLGLARSRDGVLWEKQRASPILELGGAGDFDENGLGEPALFRANGNWMMLYTGRDRTERRRLGYAVSRDGKHWEKLRQPILAGEQGWNRAVICDPTVIEQAGLLRIWYGGGDQPRPDERLNGQIGYAELLPRP